MSNDVSSCVTDVFRPGNEVRTERVADARLAGRLDRRVLFHTRAAAIIGKTQRSGTVEVPLEDTLARDG
jgi:hypothetical protein